VISADVCVEKGGTVPVTRFGYAGEHMAIVLEAGTIVAERYRLDRLLGQGGMGVVWAATHVVTRRTVAMKFVRASLHEKAELRRRLLREAHAAATVRHPNVVEILDVFALDPDTPVIVMTLLHGETLGQRLAREQPLSIADTAKILLPAISAIGTAHARGIIHRDLKPDNIYLSHEGDDTAVKVLDFGIAKLLGSAASRHDSMATQTGSTLGTPSYMAPEQAVGEKDVDHRADVWALGVIAYECLSGVRPIEGENAGQVIMRLMTTGITPLARVTRGLPKDVTSLVDRMLSRERSRRCQDLHEARSVFARYSETSTPAFGAPGSELSTTLDRESRRSDEPVVFSLRSPGENATVTLANAAPHFVSADRGQPRVERARLLGLKTLGAVAAVGLLGAMTWRFGGSSARSNRPVASSVATAAVSSGASTAPPMSAAASSSTGAEPLPMKQPEPPTAPANSAISKRATPLLAKTQATSAPSAALPTEVAETVPSQSANVPVGGAGLPPPRAQGIVPDPPF
jgi:eukaryotic-like serine/threonine-protein kinase